MESISSYIKKVFAKTKTTGALLGKEISSSESNIQSSFLVKRYNPDSLVGKKGLKVYQEMKTDDQVKASLTVKKFARLSTGWEIKPGDETNPQSVEMAEFITYVFKKMKGTFETDLLNILTAIEYGYSISEKVYGVYETGKYKGKIGLMKLGSREPFGYDFKTDEHNNVTGIVFENLNSFGQGNVGSTENPFPPEKFVIYSYNAEHSNPYGQSDLRSAYAAWWSKRLNIKWWNIFGERFGMPTVVAKYPAKAKGLDKNAIVEIDKILANLQAKSGFRIPDSITFELLEATRQGKTSYGEAIDKFDGMIARSILVPNLLGLQEQKGTGSYALGKKHFDVFLFVLEMMGKDLEETVVGEQIIRPLIDMNFGEVDMDIYPRFIFGSLAEDETAARATVLKQLADAGLVDKREEWVRGYLNIPERDLEKYPHKNPIGEIDKDPDPIPPIDDPTKIPPIDEDEDKDKKMALNRETTKFEKKVQFKELEQEMNFLGEALIKEVTPILIEWRDDIIKKADKLIRERDINGVNKLQIKGVGDFKAALRDTLIKTHLDAKLHGMEEIISVGFPATIKKKFSMMSLVKYAVEPWDPIPPTEALNYFNSKIIVTIKKAGSPKRTLTLAKLIELNYYDKRAFTITGIESNYILGQAKLLIEKGIRDGLLKATANNIKDLFTKYVQDGGIVDGKLLTASRLNTVVRTNVNEAINAGRMSMFKDPDVKDFVPYLQWSSVLDERTTEYCDGMDELIFKIGEVEQPPAHFNCRSTIVPVTKPEIEDAGGVEVSDWGKENSKVGRPQGFKLSIQGGE